MTSAEFRQWRRRQGLSVFDAAAALGIRASDVRRCEAGIIEGRRVAVPDWLEERCFAIDERQGEKMDRAQLKVDLKLHLKWTRGEDDGVRADLSRIILSGVNLRHRDLRSALFVEAIMHDANLSFADLRNADFTGANLRRAKMIGANLIGANLRRADLTGADLTGADLNDADFTGANFQSDY